MKVQKSRPTLEGAGVKLRRAFGFDDVSVFDPFLLLDDFGSDRPEDYTAGFPWHPHRGIETVTYIIHGPVEHGDSLGNGGVIGDGDVQWMTAGGGIIHQEMPVVSAGRTQGFQLWVNLPAASKMMEPRYRDVRKDTIPVVTPAPGVTARVISGTVVGAAGPVLDIVVPIEYMDVSLDGGVAWRWTPVAGHNSFAYVFSGELSVTGVEGAQSSGTLIHLGDSPLLDFQAGESGARFMLASGRPLDEPVAWGGPIVMNTQEELERAFYELDAGTFIKKK